MDLIDLTAAACLVAAAIWICLLVAANRRLRARVADMRAAVLDHRASLFCGHSADVDQRLWDRCDHD